MSGGHAAPVEVRDVARWAEGAAALAGVDWDGAPDDELWDALRALEQAARQVEAALCVVTATVSGRLQRAGRPPGSAATDAHPTRRLATTIQRLVLYAAHGRCTHPGCQTPSARCHAHRVHDHSRGGPTTLANLTDACPTHHGWIGHTPHHWRTIANPDRPGVPKWIPPGTPSPETTVVEARAPEYSPQ